MIEHLDVRPAPAERTSFHVADVRVTVFGGLGVNRSGAPSSALAGQRKCLALLAILAVAGRRGIARDKLMALLAPEVDTERARNALSQVVFRVRRALGPHIVDGKDELALSVGRATSDISEFERALAEHRLEDAAECYRGPFLDGFYLREAREFEQWTADVRSRLEQKYLSALDELASAACRCGDVAGAVGWCRRRVEADPFNTLAARQLVLALMANGDRDGALRFGLAYAERIRLEFDTEPDANFSELVRAVRIGQAPPGVANGSITIGRTGGPSRVAIDSVATGRTSGAAAGNTEREETRPLPRGVKRLAVAATLGAMLFGAEVLSGWSPGRPPLVMVPPFVNATGDTSLDTESNLATTWSTDAIVATGLLRVVASTGQSRVLPVRGNVPPLDRDRLLDAARRRGATFVILGSLEKRGADSIDLSMRVIRANTGETVLESSPARASRAASEMLARGARDRTMELLAKLLERKRAAPRTS